MRTSSKGDGQADKSPKKQAVMLAIEQIQKQFGKGSIMRWGEGPATSVAVLKTGILPLDIALGVGGIPKGRIVEIFGPEASGKTTVCLSLIAETQRSGGIAAFIDAEHALDPAWARLLGVNLDDLLVSQPDTGEQALEIAEQLIRSGGVDLVVVDSVAALVPRSEIEGEMGEAQMGLQARLMSQALRKLTGVVSKSKTTIVFTNQIRLKIGIMFGNPETTPGGLALKFYCSVRMDVRKIETLKKNNQVYGARIRVKIVKNKVAPPFKDAEMVITADGIDKDEALIDVAVNANILSKNGAFLKYGDKMLGQGKEQVKQLFAEDHKLRQHIAKEVMEKLLSKK
ncbi:recombinase RecA [Candidatus Roizmanbacteria bacterium RIFCSPHIGHO2_01_FULL_39_12c]|uniref:Protein RecA n=1 Tax=Candidatus Roizmanbacteria bacterium RIFCSPHIGHO2_01_FULL_39_12c TaxID=1802031 RepID=A0A1F7GAA1_9BACT|nr:MAG: recombinase RecA [Candidatus Roizmanbacteria bacterium RIFCSPHIGHO2_01_FULL_39_12c]OGK46453.1 MAG: recombinase RecA [Candidatus Roizmanbacteria bacterium RIFCSPLOWO2_01_FULL_40_13]